MLRLLFLTQKLMRYWLQFEAATWNVNEGKTHNGTDVAREVVQSGSAVTGLKNGDKVVAFLSYVFTLPKYAVVKENLTVIIPSEVFAPKRCSLPVTVLIACQDLIQFANFKLDGSGEYIDHSYIRKSGPLCNWRSLETHNNDIYVCCVQMIYI